MKKLLFLFAVVGLIFTGCNDDDDNDQDPGNSSQPVTSGSLSATINGESLAGSDNVARKLSNGAFMIRSDINGLMLKVVLNDFIGNATYSLDQVNDNSIIYSSVSNGDTLFFENLTGDFEVTNFNEATQEFDATFTGVLGQSSNLSTTIPAEANYSNLKVLEMPEPPLGGAVGFIDELEYYDFSGSGKLYKDGIIELTIQSNENQNLMYDFELDTTEFNFVTLLEEPFDPTYTGGFLLDLNLNPEDLVLNTWIKGGIFSPDFALRVRMPLDTTGIVSTGIEFVSNSGQSYVLPNAVLRKLPNPDNELVNYLLLTGGIEDGLQFIFYFENTNQAEFPISLEAPTLVTLAYEGIFTEKAEATLSASLGEEPNTVNVSLVIEDHGVLTAIGIPLDEQE